MPELLASSLEAPISRAVQAVIKQRRGELERLMQAHVDQELAQLAGELVEQQLANGNGTTPTPLCADRGERPPMRDRRVCRKCKVKRDVESRRRNTERRQPPTETAAADETEAPFVLGPDG